MPARDPAITPHHPSLGSSVSSAPGLPLHRRSDEHNHAPTTPNPEGSANGGSYASSGAFGIGALANRRMSNSGSQYSDGAGPRRGSLWQAVTGRKGDTDSLGSGYARMPQGEDSDGQRDAEQGRSYEITRNIRDDTARLASMSYTSSHSASSGVLSASPPRVASPDGNFNLKLPQSLSAAAHNLSRSFSPKDPAPLSRHNSSEGSTPAATPRPPKATFPVSPSSPSSRTKISPEQPSSFSQNQHPSALSVMLERSSGPSSRADSKLNSPASVRRVLSGGSVDSVAGPSRSSRVGSFEAEKDGEGAPDEEAPAREQPKASGSGPSAEATAESGPQANAMGLSMEEEGPPISFDARARRASVPFPRQASQDLHASHVKPRPKPGREGSEEAPLLAKSPENGKTLSYSTVGAPNPFEPRRGDAGLLRRARQATQDSVSAVRKASWQDVLDVLVKQPAQAVPAVILGLLLNVLDGVSYGMILFPASYVFTDYGSIGVSMFFVSCIISQLTYSLGGSIFKGGNGSMMIEAVPFFHILVNIISGEVGEDNSRAIIATTMVSFAFSAVLTGLVFFVLGYFRLGALIGYFPRHILVGCIGGVGVFLIETGLEVSRGLKEEGFEYNLETLKIFFESGHAMALWMVPLGFAIALRIITHRFTHQLIFPAYFFIIPVIFYIVIAIGGWSIPHLRETGWVFDVGATTQPWYKFYTLFDFRHFSWTAFWACIPTQMALVFFGILHVPLNVPSLGVSLSEDNVNLDRELLAHGVSNVAAGLLGTVPNYLCYVNTVLFYRVGGGSRLSGVMLAGATAVIMFVGPAVIGYLPVAVVGALIFVLGIDLAKEAVWDTRHRVNRWEYITIWAITIGMTIFDFVLGLLLGIVLSSLFFVVQNSRRRAIRAIFNGSTAKSTVRRPHSQRAFIQDVGKQTIVMKLQGFLFFGTITKVEDEIRRLLDTAAWQHNPIRFLIVDFALVGGLDFSSAEAFVRIQRLLAAKDVLLILCGADPKGLVGSALRAVDLWADQEGTRVEVFDSLNEALEWTENAYLTAFYAGVVSHKKPDVQPKSIGIPDMAKPPFSLSESFENSPRRLHLAQAGDTALPTPSLPDTEELSTAKPKFKQPLPILLQTFSAYSSDDQQHDFYFQLVPYFKSVFVKEGDVVWQQGDEPDGLFLIESGCLRATYQYEDHSEFIHETMVAGTVAGEMTMLSGAKRNATVVAERDTQLWKLDNDGLGKLEKEKPAIARQFVRIAMKVAAEEADVLSSHLVAVLS